MGKYTSPKFQIYVESPQLGQVRYFHVVVSGSRQSTQTGAFGSWADSVSKMSGTATLLQPCQKGFANTTFVETCRLQCTNVISGPPWNIKQWIKVDCLAQPLNPAESNGLYYQGELFAYYSQLFALIPSSKNSWLGPSLGDSSMSPSLGCVKLKGLNSWDVDVDIQSIPFFVFDQRCRYLTGQQKELEWNPPCSPLKEKNKWFWDDISSRNS